MHTPEPWCVAETYDNDGHLETVISAMGDQAAVAVALDFGANNPLMRVANCRRIVACVNALKGVPTETLEDGGQIRLAVDKQVAKKLAEHSQLLAALENLLATVKGDKPGAFSDAERQALAAITAAKLE
ncbi:hypothetical protein JD974_12600 [Chromobacterium haemolyticum]|uniref:Terminase n=1 Tax=Chromobacterium haemolyticum TaxID=394935 RepID=A0ABS3GPL4_9NEIS|nr:hypothetical protein [Chromobacterium haemolyticum]MBK0415246.1 hypothetical protein [Chromobacterium haemolyticum]MBO0416539.1 hypothetical protein [Chromobacterium haemolyticum]MBO0499885.1 hypothetical protein [Chromobacterium haemolyticum]